MEDCYLRPHSHGFGQGTDDQFAEGAFEAVNDDGVVLAVGRLRVTQVEVPGGGGVATSVVNFVAEEAS